jgi:hypothetical protein
MQPVTSLPQTDASFRLRLQAPALSVAGLHTTASTSESARQIEWRGQAGTVSLQGCCAALDDHLWLLDFSLDNSGPDAEVRLALPYLFYHFDQEEPVRLFNPLFGGVLEAAAAPLRISYPGPASFCLTAAAGRDWCVAAGCFNAEQRHVIIRHIPAGADGQIRLVFERILVKSGQTIRIPTQFIAIGRDWAEAMRPYRAWFQETFPRQRCRPDWWTAGNFSETRKAHCLAPFHPPEAAAGVWIFDNQGKPRTFEQVRTEIDAAIADGEAKGYRPLFYQFGWWQNMAEIQGLFMFDSLCGDYTAAHALAKQAVDYIHTRGMRTYFYTNSISAGDESAVYRDHPELFVRDGSGFPVYNMDYPMLMFCPGAPGMREYWESILKYLLVDLGVDGIFLDQACGGAPPAYCYDPRHQHEHPDTYGRDFLDLIDFIASRARELKPDCYIGGELVLDSRGVLLDEAHGYGYTGPRTPAGEYYVFTKYLCPQIYSSNGGNAIALMNGAAGQHGDPLWQKSRRVFEAACTPCRVEPTGGLAYLYGPADGRYILAVRGTDETGQARIRLPDGLEIDQSLPAGLVWVDGSGLACQAGQQPVFFELKSAIGAK